MLSLLALRIPAPWMSALTQQPTAEQSVAEILPWGPYHPPEHLIDLPPIRGLCHISRTAEVAQPVPGKPKGAAFCPSRHRLGGCSTGAS